MATQAFISSENESKLKSF